MIVEEINLFFTSLWLSGRRDKSLLPLQLTLQQMKIFVRVKPKAKEEKVEKVDDINFNVQVRELPEKGRANLAVIRALADYFNIGQSNIQIVSGSKSRLKIIEITK